VGAAVPGVGAAVPGAGLGVWVCGVALGVAVCGAGAAVCATRQIAENRMQEVRKALNFIGSFASKFNFVVSLNLGAFWFGENPADALAFPKVSGMPDR
jgi:hypothetical protein